MVYSASIAMAEASAAHRLPRVVLPARHAMFVAAGLVAALRRVPDADEGVAAPRARGCSSPAPCCCVLVLVPGIGKSVNGSRRWLSLDVVNLQPSEFMKLAVVLYAASYAVRKAAFLHARAAAAADAAAGFLPLFAVMVADRRRCCCSSPTSARSSSSSRSRSASCSWAGSTGGSSWAAVAAAARRRWRRSSSPRRTGCSGWSRSSTRGRIRSARATSCRIR